MVHSVKAKCTAAICKREMFAFFYDDSYFVKRFASVSRWRKSILLPIEEREATVNVDKLKGRLGFVDGVFNHPMVTCTGCNEVPCVCHYKLALSELQRNGKRQNKGGNRE